MGLHKGSGRYPNDGIRDGNIEKNKKDIAYIGFDTIADLQASTVLTVGGTVEARGYYDKGDGAGHKRIISLTDDGSGIALASGGFANFLHFEEATIKHLGAKQNGTDNDSPYIQLMLDLYGKAKCGNMNPNIILDIEGGGAVTDNVLVGTDIIMKNYYEIDFNNAPTIFTKAITSLDTGSQAFISGCKLSNIIALSGDTIVLAPDNVDFYSWVIDKVYVRGVEYIIKCYGSPSWWSSSISNVKGIFLKAIGYFDGVSGMTTNEIRNILLQGTAQVFEITNSHIDFEVYNLNYGLNFRTVGGIMLNNTPLFATRSIIKFENCSFEYDDKTINTSILACTYPLHIYFSHCFFRHTELIDFNLRGAKLLDFNYIACQASFIDCDTAWEDQPTAQDIVLHMQLGILYDCNLRLGEINTYGNTRIKGIKTRHGQFNLDSNTNFDVEATYSFQNGMIHVSGKATATGSVANGNVITILPFTTTNTKRQYTTQNGFESRILENGNIILGTDVIINDVVYFSFIVVV